MSSRLELANRLCILGVVMGVASGCVQPTREGVCPVRADGPKQVYLFDGDPSEQAYLAPDDEQSAPNTYTVMAIYDKGRHVTVRCEYQSSPPHDVPLTKRVDRCTFAEHENIANFYCK